MWACSKCGKEIHDGFESCWNCGKPKDGSAPAEQQTSEESQGAAPDQVKQGVNTYLTEAILVTLFCCWPLGIVAIVFAAQAKGKLDAGDYTGAAEVAQKAKSWCMVSLVLGLVAIVIYAIGIIAQKM